MKKIIALTLVSVIAAGIIAGCGSGSSSGSTAGTAGSAGTAGTAGTAG